MKNYDADYYEGGSDEMDDNGFLGEFFATEFGPDESEKDPKEKDGNWFGRIGGDGSKCKRRSRNEGGAIGCRIELRTVG